MLCILEKYLYVIFVYVYVYLYVILFAMHEKFVLIEFININS